MIGGQKIVLTTFAGRRDRMKLLLSYARAALNAGIIDEWHVWDFAHTPEDRQWLNQEFPNLRWIANKKDYRFLGWGRPDAQQAWRFEFGVRAASDFHVRLIPQDKQSADILLALGTAKNTISHLYSLDTTQSPTVAASLANVITPGLLSAKMTKPVVLEFSNGVLRVSVNGSLLFVQEIKFGASPVGVVFCGGAGEESEVYLPPPADPRQLLFVALNEGKHPFSEFYNYYESRYDIYKNTVFLKCDDDILFVNLAHLKDFIEFRIQNPWYFLVSANVVNNNICAYFQQQSRLIPLDLMQFELPQGGFGGRLWQDGKLAEQLHDYFLAAPERFTGHAHPKTAIEWDQRLSINFVAFLGRDLAEMACQYTDDEHTLSIDIPKRLGRTNAIYTPFIVSHLSFYPQNEAMDLPKVIEGYEALRDRLFQPG